MNNEYFGFVLVISSMLIGVVIFCITEYFRMKQFAEWNLIIDSAKKQISDIGLITNHSYKLINKETEESQFLCFFKLVYNHNTENVHAHCMTVTMGGEIGIWDIEYTCLLDIPTKWDIVDTGELKSLGWLME